jgi:hypothetical protein
LFINYHQSIKDSWVKKYFRTLKNQTAGSKSRLVIGMNLLVGFLEDWMGSTPDVKRLKINKLTLFSKLKEMNVEI